MVTYQRDGATLQTELRPHSEEQADGSLVGKVGLAPERDVTWDKQVRYQYYPSVSEAFGMGWDKTVGYSTLTLKFFGKLLTGQASTNHISGPLTIADVAGKSATLGHTKLFRIFGIGERELRDFEFVAHSRVGWGTLSVLYRRVDTR